MENSLVGVFASAPNRIFFLKNNLSLLSNNKKISTNLIKQEKRYLQKKSNFKKFKNPNYVPLSLL